MTDILERIEDKLKRCESIYDQTPKSTKDLLKDAAEAVRQRDVQIVALKCALEEERQRETNALCIDDELN